jgi:hypothetical protein
MEDLQIAALLARELTRRDCDVTVCDPRQWDADAPCDLVVRFFQCEWLSGLPRRVRWRRLLVGGDTPVVNGAAAVVGESKRLPLVWGRLQTPMPTWRRLLPETRDPRAVPWRRDASWLLKGAYSNTGDAVLQRDLADDRRGWRAAAVDAWLWPRRWAAQRRFEPVPVETPDGPMHVCLGVYVIDGRASGVYARLSSRPVIDYRAVDAAVLVDGRASEEGAA